MEKVLELNQILDKEIEFCENFESLLLQKKELLIHSKANELKAFDNRIYDAQKQLKEINDTRINISKKFGNGDMKLSEIIKNIEDKATARELELKRKKIQAFAQNITVTNNVINSLIEHSLKLIDGSIYSIATAMASTQTKGDYYNKNGAKEQQNLSTISAIIEEA